MRQREVSADAKPWPALAQDPEEDGLELGRWPSWRRNGSGVARGGKPPIRFSASAGYRWKVAVPGRGNSSPVVWDDRIVLTSALGHTDPATLAVLCFRLADGKLLWQSEAGPAKGPTHNKNGHASATVATDGQRIVAFFGSTGLFCYDFSGTLLWRQDLGELDQQWGTAASPVVYQDRVIQLCDCAANSYLGAWQLDSGRPLWRTPRESYGCWTTPVLVPVGAGSDRHIELVVNGSGRGEGGWVTAYAPDSGKPLWHVRGTEELVVPTTLLAGDLVFSLSGRNGPILAIRPGGAGDVTDTHVVWKLPRGGPYIPSGVAYRNRLYVLGDSGNLACYNPGDGQCIWRQRLRGKFTASLVAADGRIYATSEQGTVYVVAAADTFELLATNPLGQPCLATPAVVDGQLLIRTGRELYCFGP